MEIKINDISISEKELEATFTYEEIKKDLETEVLKESKKLQLPGFRKGKAPLALLKKMFGDVLENEAAEKVANKKFWDITEEKKLQPIGKPTLHDLKYVPNESLFIKISYEVMPVIEAKDYKGIEIEIPDFQVKDDDVNHEIEHILKANEVQEPTEQVTGKECILDVEILRIDKEGQPFEGSKTETLQIDLSDERVAKEIIDNSNGKKIGETFTFTFNEEKTIKNKEGVEEKYTETYEYSAVIKGIKKATKPALDEALIKKVTKDKVSTESELREQIKADIQKYFEQQTDDIFRSKLITEIIKNNEFAAPHALVSNVLEDYLKREEEQYKKMGYKKYDKAEASKRLAKSAEVEVKWYLIKDSIQKQENISMSEDELTALATKEAEQTGIAVDKLLNYYKSSNYAEKFVENKVFDFLKANTTIKKVTPEHTHTHNHEEDEHEG